MKTNTILRASTFERRLCPGSVKAEEGLPEVPDTDGAANSGTKTHNALRMHFSGTITNIKDIVTVCELNERETIVLSWFIGRAETIIANHGGAKKVYTELVLEDTGDKIKGTADMLVICNDDTWHLFDWKTGQGEQITAEANLQLRVYALKVVEKFGCIHLTAHLFAAGNDPKDAAITTCNYGPDEIAEARKEIYAIRDACFADNAPRLPTSERCKWCRALGNPSRCPESCRTPTVDLPAIIAQPVPPELASRLKSIYLAFKQASSAQERFEKWLKDMINTNPTVVPWAKLAEPKERRTITNAEAAFSIGMKEGWFTQDEFVKDCITVKVPAIEKLAKRTKKNKEVQSLLIQAEALEVKLTQPSIELIKE